VKTEIKSSYYLSKKLTRVEAKLFKLNQLIEEQIKENKKWRDYYKGSKDLGRRSTKNQNSYIPCCT